MFQKPVTNMLILLASASCPVLVAFMACSTCLREKPISNREMAKRGRDEMAATSRKACGRVVGGVCGRVSANACSVVSVAGSCVS